VAVVPPAWIAVVLLGTLAAFVAWSLRESPNTDTFAEGEVGEEEFPLRPSAGGLIPSAAAATERDAARDRASGVQGAQSRKPVPL
jgi:hypothetical protein